MALKIWLFGLENFYKDLEMFLKNFVRTLSLFVGGSILILIK